LNMDLNRTEITSALINRTIKKIEWEGEYLIFTLDDGKKFQCNGNSVFDTNGNYFCTDKVAEVQYY